jgi:hypothetical protein
VTLTGPSRTIIVEPAEVPDPVPVPAPEREAPPAERPVPEPEPVEQAVRA